MTQEFWVANVNITQIPASNHYDRINELEFESKETDFNKSWLCNPFMDNTIYGTVFEINSEFSWTFFIPTSIKSESIYKGYFLLNFLKGKFPGLDGIVQVGQLDTANLFHTRNLFELRLPKPNSSYIKKISLLQKFINFYYSRIHKIPLSMYILWQIDDSISQRDVFSLNNRKLATHMFKIRIFFQVPLKVDRISYMKNVELETFAYLNSIVSEIQTDLNECATLKQIFLTSWYDILTGNVFWQNDKRIFTGACYNQIYDDITLKLRPCFISANATDFVMLNNIPLPKSHNIENEILNFNANKIQRKGAIYFGKYVQKGVETQVDTYLLQEHFAQSTLIVGQQGTGKTYFLRQIINQFYKNAPQIGSLILNLAKPNQEVLYEVDNIIKYGDSELRIPYFVEGKQKEKCLQETAAYLVASLGLKNVVEKNLLSVIKSFFYNKEGLPASLKLLLLNLEKFFKEHPYHEKFQTNILRAIKNRVLALLSDSTLENILQLSEETPPWINDWLKGKKIFLDLSMCNIYVKRLLANAIFQIVRALLPDIETGGLKYLIVMDEAHILLEKPITNNPDDDDFIAREQLEKIFTNLMKTFRSKGLSFILADQEPHRLFGCVTTLPSLKFIFRLGYPDNILFSGDKNEQNFISIQRNRNALLFNGITGEKFCFKTLNV